MDRQTRNTAIAAAIIFLGFLIGGYFLPTLILAAGEISPWFGAAIGAIFVMAFFGVFWLRNRRHRRGGSSRNDDGLPG